MNLKEVCPTITHELWCKALQESFVEHHSLDYEI